MKNLLSILPNGELKKILQSGRDFLQVGAVGPDLPYVSIVDGDLFFSTQSELADKFHYEKTNQLILKAFNEIKKIPGTSANKEKRLIFSFYLGFASHIIADGIIHPFVRDKVGNYHKNQTAHRVLEMQLDVLLFHHLTKKSHAPLNLNYSNIHDELINFNNDFYPEVNLVLKLFSRLISEVYNLNYNVSLINNWIKELHSMFGVAEGEHPKIYRISGFTDDFLHIDYNDLHNKYKSILTLSKPVDSNYNFLKKNQIHYFDDCLPHFYNTFIPLANKCYDYIFNNKGELTDNDIPPINLYTGRNLRSNNLDSIPILWEHYFEENEYLAFALVGNRIRVVFLTPDGEYKFVDEKNKYHGLIYTYSIDRLLLRQAVEELEYLINSNKTSESDLHNFFERYPDFILNEGYKAIHSKIVLEKSDSNQLIPDFLLEPLDTNNLCDILDLKKPNQKIFIMKKNRVRFSSAIHESVAQLRTYGNYFEEKKHRNKIYKEYGLLSYKPKLFVIIGRSSGIDPISKKQIESDFPNVTIRTYDDILARMKIRLRK